MQVVGDTVATHRVALTVRSRRGLDVCPEAELGVFAHDRLHKLGWAPVIFP